MKNLQNAALAAVALGLVVVGQPSEAEASAKVLALCNKFNYQIQEGDLTGVYAGQWQEGLSTNDHVLVVKSVRNNRATVLYAVDAWPQYGIKARCREATGTVRRSNVLNKFSLRLDFGGGHRATYDFFDSGGVSATYRSSGGTTHGSLEKTK